MSSQREKFEWVVPSAFDEVLEPEKRPDVIKKLCADLAADGLDPGTVRITGVILRSEGRVIQGLVERV
jgi:hypothetical protein